VRGKRRAITTCWSSSAATAVRPSPPLPCAPPRQFANGARARRLKLRRLGRAMVRGAALSTLAGSADDHRRRVDAMLQVAWSQVRACALVAVPLFASFAVHVPRLPGAPLHESAPHTSAA